MNYEVLFDLEDVYNALFKRKIKRGAFKAAEYSQQRRSLVDYIYRIGQIFNMKENIS